MHPEHLNRLKKILLGEIIHDGSMPLITGVCVDSRLASPHKLFFALHGVDHDGHDFVNDAFQNGASAAVVSRQGLSRIKNRKAGALVIVESPLQSLQHLAKWWRKKAIASALAITGSSGKTITKEALRHILIRKNIMCSPGSFNSQIGVPLAIFSRDFESDLGILEVGISAPGEMEKLADIVEPDFGILTNVGLAHIASFDSKKAIAKEKISLFKNISTDGWVLIPEGDPLLEAESSSLQCRVVRVGPTCSVLGMSRKSWTQQGQLVELSCPGKAPIELLIHTRSPEILQDLHFASVAARLLGVSLSGIASALAEFREVPTRLESWSAPGGISIFCDSNASDPFSIGTSLKTASLETTKNGRFFLVFSGFPDLGDHSSKAYKEVGKLASQHGVTDLVLVGDDLLNAVAEGYKAECSKNRITTHPDTASLKKHLISEIGFGDTILSCGSPSSGLLQASQDVSGATAQRALWVDLGAIQNNVAKFKRMTGGRKIIAMLKALAYGTDLARLAQRIARLDIHHIGVSSTYEGVQVRKAGADQEIFVFLPDANDLMSINKYRLTPVIYSAELAGDFIRAVSGAEKKTNVHLKIDSGMHRLGVSPDEAFEVAKRIDGCAHLRLTGVCTHLAAADDPSADEFTRTQIKTFAKIFEHLKKNGFKDLTAHAANTAGCIRFPESHFDFVRVGIGLYGVLPSQKMTNTIGLESALAVTSRVASVRTCQAGETVGYARSFKAKREMRLGVVPFGYDDGLPWKVSDQGCVSIDGRLAPIVGRVSMDQIQIDLSDLPDVDVGTEVLIYGTRNGYSLAPERVAEQANSIPHELLIRLGRRVQRIYIDP